MATPDEQLTYRRLTGAALLVVAFAVIWGTAFLMHIAPPDAWWVWPYLLTVTPIGLATLGFGYGMLLDIIVPRGVEDVPPEERR